MTKLKSKRLLSLLLSLAMLVTLVATPVYAESGDDADGTAIVQSTSTDDSSGDTDTGETTYEEDTSSDSDGEEETEGEAEAEELDSNGDVTTDTSSTVWDGSIATGFASGTGTSEDPYIIATGAQLAYLAQQVNAGTSYSGCYFKLSADIDLDSQQWTPIGKTNYPFSGKFDGDGHTISNLYSVYGSRSLGSNVKSNVGLFGYTTSGSISNFNIVNATVSGDLNVGVVAGCPYTSMYSNISVTGTIKVDGYAYVGGAFGKNAYANITNVDVKGNTESYVKAESENYRTYVGGLIGFMGEGSVTVSNCDVEIDVIGSTCDVGGLLGILHYGNTLTNCTYKGTVTVTNPDEECGDEIGGLVGTVMNRTSDNSIMSCTFTGSVYSGENNITSTASAYGAYYYDDFDTSSSYTFTGTSVTYNDTDASVTVSSSSLVAMIGSTYYTSLADAVAAANDAGSATTVTLVNAATVDSTITVSGNVTIDLNGYTITASTTLFKVTSTGALTVTDSGENGTINITSSSDVYFVNGAGADANVKVESGTINVTSTGGKAVLIWNSSVNISGGTFVVKGSTSAHGIYAKSGETYTSTISGDDVKLTVTYNSTNVAAANLVSGSVTITGGTYNVSPTTSLLATGYSVTANDDGTYTVVNKTITVTVGDTTSTYTSIYEALKAANNATSAATITLHSDVEFISSLTFSNSNGITFDLNGYTMTTSDNFTGQVVFNLSSLFTLTDSSEESTGSIVVNNSVSTTVFNNASTFNFTGGTIAFTSGYSGNTAVIKNTSGATLNVTGDAAISAAQTTQNSMYAVQDSGGTITFNTTGMISVTSAGNAYGVNGSGANTALTLTNAAMAVTTSGSSTEAAGLWNVYLANMSNGTITVTAENGKAYGIYAKSNSSNSYSAIAGGYVSVSGSTESCISGSVAVSGGYFSHTPANFLADDCAVFGTSNTIYPYTVGSSSAGVAQIGTTQYLTLAEAVAVANAAESDTTITLLKNVVLDSSVVIGNSSAAITLDLAGCNITRGSSTTGYLIGVTSGASLTVKDSSEGAAGYIDGSTYTTASGTYVGYSILTNGTLTLESGTLKGYYGVYVSGSNASFTVHDGAVSGTYFGIMQSNGAVTVDGGTVSGTRAIYGNAGTLTVSGGTVNGSQMGLSIGGTLTVNVKDSAVITTSESSSTTWAMYLWQDSYTGTTTIEGGTIGGENSKYGVTAQSGTVKVTGGTITATDAAFAVVNVGTEGTISGDNTVISSEYGAEVLSGASLTISGGEITGTSCGVFVSEGTSDNYSTLEITGGEIKANSIGVCTNGSQNYTKIIMSGGTITAPYGMYLPAMNSITEISGGTITASATGVEIRAGSLTVSGGEIKSTSEEFAYTFNGSGTTVVGAGIAISQHSTNQKVTVTITGGTITSNHYGIFEVNTYSTSTSDVTLNISEGEDNSSPSVSGETAAVYSVSLSGDVDGLVEGVTTYSSEATTVSISAGTFSDQIPLDYCADGYQPSTAKTEGESTYYTVENKTAVAMIAHDDADDVYYDTLSEAVEAASSETEETITIIGAATVTESMEVSKDVTIDVADGSITIGTAGTTTSEVTLTIAEGATVTITASGDGYVADYGTIAVNGTLDISELGYTTDTSEAGGLLGQTSGKMSFGEHGVFVAPTVWNELWSWTPNMTSATSNNGIFSSAAVGAIVQCGDSEWKCTTAFESASYDSNVTYWSEAMKTGVVAKNIDLNSGVIALNFYIYIADGDEVTSVQVDEKTYTALESYYDSETGYYVFSQTVAPTKMTVDCKVIITLSDGSTVEYSTTVRDYVTEAFDSASDNEKNIMAAMLNYGAMCQVYYYGTNSTDLANANLSDEYKKSSYSISDYANVLSNVSSSTSGSGITLSKLSMTQGSTNTLTLTYSSLSVNDLSQCNVSVTYNGEAWTDYSISGMKLTITDIGANMLGTNFTVTVGNETYSSTASISGYYYISSLLSSDTNNSNTNLVNMLCSMVAYCESYVSQ